MVVVLKNHTLWLRLGDEKEKEEQEERSRREIRRTRKWDIERNDAKRENN
jgi:hypothetical protein